MIIAIDGTSASGKTTLARRLAARLGYLYFDTGVMYRALTLAALRQGLSMSDESALSSLAAGITIDVTSPTASDGRPCTVLLDGEDVTEALRAPEVSQMASVVSAIPEVRHQMVRRQRELAARSGGVVEGRDIGTVVFPDATLKVFLTAEPEVRARRRFDELTRRGVAASWEDVLAEQRERDRRDSTRPDSPLRPAEGAMIVDTSRLTLPEVVEAVVALLPRSGNPLTR